MVKRCSFVIFTVFFVLISCLNTITIDAMEREHDIYKDTDIITQLKQVNKNNEHPRLMMKDYDIKRIKEYIGEDKFISAQFSNLKVTSENILKEQPVKYEFADGVRLLEVSRTALSRLQVLGFMYNITGEDKYAERGWLELETICDANPDRKNYSFPNWNPKHFLDTAEMTNAAAIGYDWLYNYLNEEQRKLVKEAIYTKGIKEALSSYNNQRFWTDEKSNWCAVCNSGIALGALAIGDDEKYQNDCRRFLNLAINNISNVLKSYSPNGGWIEGPSYWSYATSYCAYFISSLESALDTDYDITDGTNFTKAGDFLIYITGSTGVFNFGDAGSQKIKNPAMVWLSNKFNNGRYLWYYKKVISTVDSSPLAIIWYNSRVKEHNVDDQDMYFPGVEVGTMHTSILEKDDTFLAFKAGRNNVSHGDLDLGSFVYDAQGERWFEDLGIENYNVDGYWDMGENGKRWNYYKKRAEGHNTLVINSEGKGPDQNIEASTNIKSFISDKNKTTAVLDLTNAYTPNVLVANRTFTLMKDEKKVFIEDLILNERQLDIQWAAHTKADVQLSIDKRTAVLYKNGKRIEMNIKYPFDGYFDLEKLTSKDGSNIEQFICNDLVMHIKTSDNLRILVEITQ